MLSDGYKRELKQRFREKSAQILLLLTMFFNVR